MRPLALVAGDWASGLRGAVTRLLPNAASRLFRKYVALLIGLVGAVLAGSAAIEAWYSYRENREALVQLQREKAKGAAAVIERFVREIESQVGWTTHSTGATDSTAAVARRFDALRLLRQAPAVTEVAFVDAEGRETLKVSRLAMDVIASGIDHGTSPAFATARSARRYLGPVYFRKESEPYMTMAVAGRGTRPGVTIAEVNLKFVWDVVSGIKVGRAGAAYVVDRQGHLVAHPDIGLVLRRTDASRLPYIAAAMKATAAPGGGLDIPPVGRDWTGREVLTAAAAIEPLGWRVLVDLPTSEAFAPLEASLWRTLLVAIGGLGLAALSALWLASRLTGPIGALAAGAERIGAGDLDHRIEVTTGDEVEALAASFNAMGGRLKESYEGLERKVEARTTELAESLEYQTAISEVLAVISRSPGELHLVLDAIVATARKLCRAEDALINLRDGPVLRLRAHAGGISVRKEWPIERNYVAGRCVIDGETIHVEDFAAVGAEYAHPRADPITSRHRTALATPLLREGVALGALIVRRGVVQPFTERQIALLETFADQAVIAIENARLYEAEQARTRELQESLEYQTAVSEVLNTIARSPADMPGIMQAIADCAARVCGPCDASVLRPVGGVLRLYAHGCTLDRDIPPTTVALHRGVEITDGTVSGRAFLRKQTVHVENLELELDEFPDARPHQQEVAHRTTLATPLLMDDEPLGVIYLVRDEVRPFTGQDRKLLESFADQAVIAMNNARLFEAEQARTREVEAKAAELAETLAIQTATAEVLGVISRSPSALQPVLDAIATTATRICEAGAAVIWQLDDGAFKLKAFTNVTPERLAYLRDNPIRLDRGTPASCAFIDRRTWHISDIQADPDFAQSDIVRNRHHRTVLAVPLLRQGSSIGVIALVHGVVRPFSDRQIRLVETFADQAVIAIENARLLEELQTRQRELEARSTELAESLEYQTAIADVLGVIARSPGELRPVFRIIAENAVRLCGGMWSTVHQFDDELISLVAHHNLGSDEAIAEVERAFPRPPGKGLVDKAIQTRSIVNLRDFNDAPEYPHQRALRATGMRSMLAIPLLNSHRAVGAIAVASAAPAAFSERHASLLETFADQAVIAIENARLFEAEQTRTRELQESLEYQTAVSEVLRTVGTTPGQLQPIFNSVLSRVMQLCKADAAAVFLFDGEEYHVVAQQGARPLMRAQLAGQRFRPEQDMPTSHAIRKRRAVNVVNVMADPGFRLTPADVEEGACSVFSVPILRDERVIGAITGWRREVRPFTDRQISVAATFADQAAIAIENARLFEEVRARTQELSRSLGELRALGEVGRTVSATLDLTEVLKSVIETACGLADATGGAIYVLDAGKGEFHLAIGHNMSDDHIEQVRAAPIRLADPIVGEAGTRREAVQVEDLRRLPPSPLLDILIGKGVRAVLAVPLQRHGELIGALAVRRTRTEAFAPETVGLLEAFAAQSAIAIHNARLYAEITDKSHQLEVASQHKSQFLANMSHELRTPLNAILGYSELLADGTYGDMAERQKGVLERIERNGKHLLGLINDVLDLSKIEAGELSLAEEDYSMASLVRTAIVATEPLARQKGLALEARIAEAMPTGRGDPRRLSQVLLNLIGNAIKFTDQGGVTVAASCDGESFRVEVADTGPGIAAADLERIFEKFQQVDNTSTRKKGGSGLGLAIAREFVQLHGGNIGARSEPGKGATFSFVLPVAGNAPAAPNATADIAQPRP